MTIRPFPEVKDVHPVVIPLPGSDLLTLNLYAVGAGPVTLIDAGLKLPWWVDFIRSSLRSRGLDLGDIERIIITHGHMDHFGLAMSIREAARREIPNPLMEIKRSRLPDPNYQSLRTFMESLDRLKSLDVRLVFPGHGEYMDYLHEIVDGYFVHHRERMNLVWQALKKESRPLYRLIDDVFPYVPEGDTFLAVSELIVHLEILVGEGRAELADPGPPAVCRAL